MKSCLRQRISRFVREIVLRHYLIPYSRSGLEAGLVPFLSAESPIALVDVGASSGEFCAAVEAYCGVRQALLVEPLPGRCEELRRRFPDPRFMIREFALAERARTAHMDVLDFDCSSSLLDVKPEVGGAGTLLDLRIRKRIQVQVSTLDDVLDEVGWNGVVDLLKIDVQGAEMLVINGGRRTLGRTRMVWVEVSFRPQYEGSAVFPEVFDFMNDNAFRLCTSQEGFRGVDRELLQSDALFCVSAP